MATEYYQKIYRANGWHFSLQMVLAREEKLLGAVTFYRTIGKDDFLYDDIFIVDLLKDHLSYRLAKEMEQEAAQENIRLPRRQRPTTLQGGSAIFSESFWQGWTMRKSAERCASVSIP